MALELLFCKLEVYALDSRNFNGLFTLADLYLDGIALIEFLVRFDTLFKDPALIELVVFLCFNFKFDVVAVLAYSLVVINVVEVRHSVIALLAASLEEVTEEEGNEYRCTYDNYYYYRSKHRYYER